MEIVGYNAEAVYSNFRDILQMNKFGNYSIRWLHSHRHALFEPLQRNIDPMYVIFKREFFIKFGKMFPKFARENPSMAGYGESINEESLELALKYDCMLVFIHKEGVYTIYPAQVKKFCIKNDLIRTQERKNLVVNPNYSGEVEVIKERTYSFPLKLMENIDHKYQ